jgi:tRNA (guanine10-N2)-dimethyltransferase
MISNKCLVLELSGEHSELPFAEVNAVIYALSKSHKEHFENFQIARTTPRLALVHLPDSIELIDLAAQLQRRLAMCHNINELIMHGTFDEIRLKLEDQTLVKNSLPKDSTFKLFTRRLKEYDDDKFMKKLNLLKAQIIKSFSKRRLVNVKYPDFEIVLYHNGEHELYLVKKIADIPRSAFETRKPQNRPYFAPVSLHPRLARCIINLAGLTDGGVILDPFCGTGGLLLEAGLMDFTTIGADINERMTNGTKTNLNNWHINNYTILQSDISKLPERLKTVSKARSKNNNTAPTLLPDAIVTEPPYGRASTTAGRTVESVLKDSFNVFFEILPSAGRLVISLPGAELPNNVTNKFEILDKYTVHIHKSLTKSIYVMQKK